MEMILLNFAETVIGRYGWCHQNQKWVMMQNLPNRHGHRYFPILVPVAFGVRTLS